MGNWRGKGFVLRIVVLVLLVGLSACAAPAAAPTPSSPSRGQPAGALPGQAAQTPSPTQAPTPMPSPTPKPALQMPTVEQVNEGLLPYLATITGMDKTNAGRIPSFVCGNIEAMGSDGRNLNLSGPACGVYFTVEREGKRYVVVADRRNAGLVPEEELLSLGVDPGVLDGLPSVSELDRALLEEWGVDTSVPPDQLPFAIISKARAWMYYMQNFSMPETLEIELIGLNGKTEKLEIDTQSFFNDWDYAQKILSKIYSPEFNVVYSKKAGGFIRNRNTVEADHLWDLWLGMRMLHYHTEFSPRMSMFGPLTMEDAMMGVRAEMNWASTLLDVGQYYFNAPIIDKQGFAHPNMDAFRMDAGQYAVYNPFTADVNPRVVRASFWEGTDGKTLLGELLVEVTDPETGKELHFEFEHFTAARRENGEWVPENDIWAEALEHSRWGWANNLNIPLEPGQMLGYVSDPEVDIYSTGRHVQFGQVISPNGWVLNPNSSLFSPPTTFLQALSMILTDKYEGLLQEFQPAPVAPQGETGWWFGGNGQNHGRGYIPTTPLDVRRGLNMVVYAPGPGRSSHRKGWQDQLPDYLRRNAKTFAYAFPRRGHRLPRHYRA